MQPSQFSYMANGTNGGSYSPSSPQVQHAQNMIIQLNEAMLVILKQHDMKIQEKIAELALADVQK
jgi:hypothetical protein